MSLRIFLDSSTAFKHLATRLSLGNGAARRNAAGQPDIATDGRTTSDCNAAEDGRPGIDNHVVLDDRMAQVAFYQRAMFIHRETLGAQRHGLIQPHMLANNSGFPDDDAGAVVNKKPASDFRAGVDFDT